MIKNLSLFLACAVLIGSAAMASAHPPRDGERIDRLAEALGIDAAQAEQVADIIRSAHESLRIEMEALVCAQKAETHAELATVLTAEQLADLEALHDDRRGRRGHFGPRRGPGNIECPDGTSGAE